MNVKILCSTILLVLVFARGSFAQESQPASSLAMKADAIVISEPPVESPRRPFALKMPMAAWAGMAAADQITTYQFLTEYQGVLHEQNPLVNRLEGHPAMMVAVGGGIDAATGWAAWRLLGRKHPRLAAAVFLGAAAYRAYLVGWNVNEMRGARAFVAAHPSAQR